MSKKQQPKILVVDDQPINIKLLQRKLERQGMEVYVAYNGRECLQIVEANQPDLILLDIMMPEMDGIETCQRLKSNPKTETIPIIFITAKASKEGKLEGLEAGAVDYITKPIDLDETLARVRTQLRLQEMFHENLQLQERLGDARKAASVGAITQGIAHNLNNLLGVVVGYLDLIKNGHDSPDMVKRSVGLMDHAITRMVNIIRQLGTIANNERLELTALTVADLIDSSIERFNDDYEVHAEVNVESSLEEDTQISANAETFEIILGKLLANAWESYPKDTPPQERNIQLKASIQRERGPAMLQLQVIDQGEGIAPQVRETLFEPFITTKTSVGRGMGLTIARHTIRNLDGELYVKENPDGGAIATLTHPL
ncbi:hybrid sensor histidine kinase/response regulator [Coraliomargarita sp. SDUM461004]|uniref:histidine kinase n=1 Tax=Thalassobacterium sedimentorum TaxID=3041258 RepID=A0ABU1AGW9_9BACT|nr:hybrid sensor histidine kinase/response regulator [Coraliomargarita sp. SDUM461004]MDQ8193979.1 hybrid sensor histidine kinase/response regulator [Coraliomargarita sp. SDUM461004]